MLRGVAEKSPPRSFFLKIPCSSKMHRCKPRKNFNSKAFGRVLKDTPKCRLFKNA